MVKATEVPIGGYGIFPKADLSEIYIKSWNNNGTTSIITYKPLAQNMETATTIIKEDPTEKIIGRIAQLEEKLDSIIASSPKVATTPEPAQKGVNKNANIY